MVVVSGTLSKDFMEQDKKLKEKDKQAKKSSTLMEHSECEHGIGRGKESITKFLYTRHKMEVMYPKK